MPRFGGLTCISRSNKHGRECSRNYDRGEGLNVCWHGEGSVRRDYMVQKLYTAQEVITIICKLALTQQAVLPFHPSKSRRLLSSPPIACSAPDRGEVQEFRALIQLIIFLSGLPALSCSSRCTSSWMRNRSSLRRTNSLSAITSARAAKKPSHHGLVQCAPLVLYLSQKSCCDHKKRCQGTSQC